LTSGIVSKKTITRMKRHLQNGREIFASYSLDKGFSSRIYRGLKKLNIQRTNNPMANKLNRVFKKRSTNGKQIREEMINILSHK
jgi:hypothetical protein